MSVLPLPPPEALWTPPVPGLAPSGALLLGDSFNMRHPLTGGGMTVALSDTRLLCEMLQPLPSFSNAVATAERTAEFYTARKPLSATINTLANALYKVARAAGWLKSALARGLGCAQQLGPMPACHLLHAGVLRDGRPRTRGDAASLLRLPVTGRYLLCRCVLFGGCLCWDMPKHGVEDLIDSMGCSTGPVSLLSGLNPSPSVLVMHFFMVALYGVGRLMLPRPTFR